MMNTVAVLGLGYVGLPLAEALVKSRKYRVIGIDIDERKIISAKKKIRSAFFEAARDFSKISAADITVVCVPTPVFKNFKPDYGPLQNACRQIAQFRKTGALVIIESTVNPGTCEEILLPLFGSKKNKDTSLLLSHCPERIDPGNSKWTLLNIPRIVGGLNRESLKKTAAFYRSFMKAEVKEVSSLKVAEASKIVENTFRDINIAYVNELAKSFDRLGIDVVEVIEAAKTKPFAFMAHYPGCGIGGHCIPIDPYYLIERAKRAGFSHKFLKMARRVNRSMPAYTVSLLEQELKKCGQKLRGNTIGLLGLAYKKDIGDLRESPALEILKIMKRKKANVITYDPFAPKFSTVRSLKRFFGKVKGGAIVVATDHTLFKNISPALFEKYGCAVVIDGRNILSKEKLQEHGIIYKGIGH